MANTKKQKERIEKDLYARFTHPSPSLKKKWEKRRKEKGSGQEILDQEFNEWLNEGKDLSNLKKDYENRIANELWNNRAFRQDVIKARQIYLENVKLPLKQQDENCTKRLNRKLSNKYHLNFGWLLWLTNCIEIGENNPRKLILYLIRKKGVKGTHSSLEIYFPLPESVYTEATIYLRMQEPDVFGDYYSQQQHGGNKVDRELHLLFEQWQAVNFDPKKKKTFRQQYVNAHLNNPLAENDFNQAMKRYKRKNRGGKSVASD